MNDICAYLRENKFYLFEFVNTLRASKCSKTESNIKNYEIKITKATKYDIYIVKTSHNVKTEYKNSVGSPKAVINILKNRIKI